MMISIVPVIDQGRQFESTIHTLPYPIIVIWARYSPSSYTFKISCCTSTAVDAEATCFWSFWGCGAVGRPSTFRSQHCYFEKNFRVAKYLKDSILKACSRSAEANRIGNDGSESALPTGCTTSTALAVGMAVFGDDWSERGLGWSGRRNSVLASEGKLVL